MSHRYDAWAAEMVDTDRPRDAAANKTGGLATAAALRLMRGQHLRMGLFMRRRGLTDGK